MNGNSSLYEKKEIAFFKIITYIFHEFGMTYEQCGFWMGHTEAAPKTQVVLRISIRKRKGIDFNWSMDIHISFLDNSKNINSDFISKVSNSPAVVCTRILMFLSIYLSMNCLFSKFKFHKTYCLTGYIKLLNLYINASYMLNVKHGLYLA